MSPQTSGIHHVTAIAGDPQRNLNFYEGILGLKLVKRTVNFDDPGTYHLYYGDGIGHPGTILTFFPWPGTPKGRRGAGQVATVSFAIPLQSIGYWVGRLVKHGVRFERPQERFEERVISFEDPDGLGLELVGYDGAEDLPYWEEGPVPGENAIRGFHSVTLWEQDHEETVKLLTETLGFRPLRDDGNRFRYVAGEGGPGNIVDVLHLPDGRRGLVSVGTVHHVAWRVANDEEQRELRAEISDLGLNVTHVLDRQYFRSIYFREPGGVLFEIATDPPGFTVDEEPEHLGESLKLPPWLEPHRSELEEVLPPIRLPRSEEDVAGPRQEPDFVHRFIPGDEPPLTLLLLHGTGGDENDMLSLGRELAPGAALLSPRGRVLENGMARFFRRLAEGMFDEEDLRFRTHELADFVEEASGEYGFDLDNLFAVGFSNGANIAASLLLLRPGLLRGAILFRPMVPLEPEVMPELSGTAVFIAAGRADQMVPAQSTEQLAELLEKAGAEVTLRWQQAGHALKPAEVKDAGRWLSQRVSG